VERDERGVLRVQRRQIGRLLNHRLDVAFSLRELQHRRAVFPLEQELNAPNATLHLPDASEGARRVEHLGLGVVYVLALGHGEDEVLLLA
jgi:hypothetical protein